MTVSRTFITCPGCGERLPVSTGSVIELVDNGVYPDIPCIRIHHNKEK